jgi:hypothetical protein
LLGQPKDWNQLLGQPIWNGTNFKTTEFVTLELDLLFLMLIFAVFSLVVFFATPVMTSCMVGRPLIIIKSLFLHVQHAKTSIEYICHFIQQISLENDNVYPA